MSVIQDLYTSVLKGKADDARRYTQEALDENIAPDEIIAKGMNSAMEEVGLRFSRNEIFLPEMMVAARAMKAGMEVIEPLIVKESAKGFGKIVLGTVKGDLHDVGKNLVAMLFKGAGFEVVDLGVDVSKEKFQEQIEDTRPQLVGISALLTTVLPNVEETVAFLKNSQANMDCKIMVGGAPITEEFSKSVKADGYAPDAGSAVQVAKKLIGKA